VTNHINLILANLYKQLHSLGCKQQLTLERLSWDLFALQIK